MGRKPEGEQALTGAERQARYRARLVSMTPPLPSPSKAPPAKTRPMPRPQQWDAALATLVRLQAEYGAWLDAMPEATRDSATGQALQAIIDLDLDELLAVRPPRGFGRD